MDYDSAVHSLQCPKCRHGMKEVTHQDITIDRCTNCEGLWFDGNELQELKRTPGSEILDTGSPYEGRKYDNSGTINCPRCGRTMENSSDWKQVHIWYEVCRDHGIFLDAGEFVDFKNATALDWFRDVVKGRRKIASS